MTKPNAATDEITRLREQSNAAIAARDAERVVSFMADTIRVRVAGGPELVGREANRAAFAEQFADKSFIGYVRTVNLIDVHAKGTTADERGTWVGRWRMRTGTHEQRGRYTAEWECAPLGWHIVRESYSER